MVVPGVPEASLIYVRDSTRGAGQMPPIATLLPDDDHLAITWSWIDTLATCP